MPLLFGCIFFVLTVAPAAFVTYLANLKFHKHKAPRQKWLWLVPIFLISAALMFTSLVFAAALTFRR